MSAIERSDISEIPDQVLQTASSGLSDVDDAPTAPKLRKIDKNCTDSTKTF